MRGGRLWQQRGIFNRQDAKLAKGTFISWRTWRLGGWISSWKLEFAAKVAERETGMAASSQASKKSAQIRVNP